MSTKYLILHRNPGCSSRWTKDYTPDYLFDSIEWVEQWITDKRISGCRGEYMVVQCLYQNLPSTSENITVK